MTNDKRLPSGGSGPVDESFSGGHSARGRLNSMGPHPMGVVRLLLRILVRDERNFIIDSIHDIRVIGVGVVFGVGLA